MTEPDPSPPLLIDVTGLAKLLDRSEYTLRRNAAAGLLPRPALIGGSVKWRWEEISQWIAAGCPRQSKWEQLKTNSGETK